uniref:Uncharacterized protein n=1 Tax=Rhizophora mucronata TaxID=61149 RepID=A0A2P2NHP1_RHIMU
MTRIKLHIPSLTKSFLKFSVTLLQCKWAIMVKVIIVLFTFPKKVLIFWEGCTISNASGFYTLRYFCVLLG